MVLAIVVALGVGCGALERSDGDPAGGGEATDASGPYLGTTVSDEPPQTGGSLAYGLPAETNSWNPSVAQWAAYSMQVARALFDPLFLFDADGNVQNNVVEKVEHNDAYTEWTVTIRSGITFHNGKKLTAADVVRESKLNRESPVLGGAYRLATIESSDVLDEHTFRTRTRKPWPTFRQQSTTQLGFVLDPDWLTSGDYQRPIGTGPFRIDRWEVGKRLVVTRNPDYWRSDRWGNRLPYLDRIEFQIVPSDQERAELLSAGKLDVMMQTLTTPNLVQLRTRCRAGELQCFSDEKGETPEDLVVLNTSKAPLNSLDARRALAMAVDRDDYVRHVTGGLNQPADSMFAPSSPWYSPTKYPDYDPTEAARLAGRVKVRNKGVFRFELLAPPTEEANRVTRYLQDAWRKVGIDVDVVTLDNQKKIIQQVSGKYQASLTQLFDSTHPVGMTAYLDPEPVRDDQLTVAFARLADPEIGVRAEALVRADPPENSTWRTATARLVERVNIMVPFIWLDHAPRTVVARPNVVNITQATLPDGGIAQDFHLGSHAVSQIWIKR
jgi:peptide/nickel transport system substrate-binding protein